MRIRVAYDISVLAQYFNYSDSKSGIYRVYEEVMYQLTQRDDISLTAVALCGDDLLLNATKSRLHIEEHRDRGYEFADAFQTNCGLTKFYERTFNRYLSKEFTKVPKIGMRSFYIRGLARLMYSLQIRGPIKISPVFDSHKFDVFHSPHLRLPPESLTAGVPRVITIYDLIPIHGIDFVPPVSTASFKKILDSINIKRDWVIAISEFTKNEFCEYTGMSPERVFVIPLAVAEGLHRVEDTNTIEKVRRKYGIPSGDYVLSVSSLEARRNLPRVIKSFFEVVSAYPELEVNLVLTGRRGFGEDTIFSAVEAAPDLRRRVIFTGYVDDEDLGALYSGATVFVYASLYEGFGLPPLEAMHCGTPVITSNSTSLPEVVGDGGIMVDPDDSEALCSALYQVLTDVDLRARLSVSGRSRAKNFSWSKTAAATVDVYKTAVAKR